MNEADIYRNLAAPFPLEDLEWRVQHSGKGKTKPGDKAMMLPYVTARAVQDRFSTAIGVGHWRHSVRKEADGWIARIEVKIGDEWVWHEDGSPETDIEAFKGGISKALVRCAVNFGVGAYLYDFPFQWVTLEGHGDKGYPPRNWQPDIGKIPPDCRPAKGGGRPATAAPVARQAEPVPPEDPQPQRPAPAAPGEPQHVSQVAGELGLPEKEAAECVKRLEAALKLVPVKPETMRMLIQPVDWKKLREQGKAYAHFAEAAIRTDRDESGTYKSFRWVLDRTDLAERESDVEKGRQWRDWIRGPLYKNCLIIEAWSKAVIAKRTVRPAEKPATKPAAEVDDVGDPLDVPEFWEDYGSQGREP